MLFNQKDEWGFYGTPRKYVVILYLNGLEDNINRQFSRFPYPNNDPMIAVNNGREIQVDDW